MPVKNGFGRTDTEEGRERTKNPQFFPKMPQDGHALAILGNGPLPGST